MRVYTWNKYGLKITVKIEVPEKVNVAKDRITDRGYGKMDSNFNYDFEYLGSFDTLYTDKNLFMYPSLFTYVLKDIFNIDYLLWLSTCK